MTMNGLSWLQANSVDLSVISPMTGYALCYGRSAGQELEVYGAEAEKAVEAWYKKLKCTQREFITAVRLCDEQDSQPSQPPTGLDNKPMSIGDLSAFLVATCGGEAEFWERRCSLSYCLSALTMFIMQNRSDDRPCLHDPKIVALKALGYAVEEVKKRERPKSVTVNTNGVENV
jgi:hypothetical protein